uniref:Uncharacterized protein n=1 Tax=Ditylenchus dipsaci TaxID=166011 RepID=A0A915CN00_9BILA
MYRNEIQWKSTNTSVSPIGKESQFCNKFAFSPLTKQLVDAITRKHLHSTILHRELPKLVCLCHRKLILSLGKYNSETTKLNLSHYEMEKPRKCRSLSRSLQLINKKPMDSTTRSHQKSLISSA